MRGHGGRNAVAGDTRDGGNKATRGERRIVERQAGRQNKTKIIKSYKGACVHITGKDAGGGGYHGHAALSKSAM